MTNPFVNKPLIRLRQAKTIIDDSVLARSKLNPRPQPQKGSKTNASKKEAYLALLVLSAQNQATPWQEVIDDWNITHSQITYWCCNYGRTGQGVPNRQGHVLTIHDYTGGQLYHYEFEDRDWHKGKSLLSGNNLQN